MEDCTRRVKDMTKNVRTALSHPLIDAALDSAILEGDGEVDALRDALHTATFTADEVRTSIDSQTDWPVNGRAQPTIALCESCVRQQLQQASARLVDCEKQLATVQEDYIRLKKVCAAPITAGGFMRCANWPVLCVGPTRVRHADLLRDAGGLVRGYGELREDVAAVESARC